MHFDSGKFGAMIVVVALLVTTVIGFTTDVTKVPYQRMDYDYVTDVTGLFDTEEIPKYIDYNPNSNYVGWDLVTYTQSNQPNNYRYVVTPGTSTSESHSITVGTEFPTASFFTGVSANVTMIFAQYGNFSYNMGTIINSPYGAYNVSAYISTDPDSSSVQFNDRAITYLSSIITAQVPTYGTYGEIVIDLVNTNPYPIWMFNSSNLTKVADDGTLQAYHLVLQDKNAPEKLVVDPITLTVNAYRGGTIVWTDVASNVMCMYAYKSTSNENDGMNNNDISVQWNYTLTSGATYGYADPTSGVTFDRTEMLPATWSNGYSPKSIDFLVGYNVDVGGAQSLEVRFPARISYTNADVDIMWSADKTLSIVSPLGESITLGNWLGIKIHFDYLSGVMTLTPTGRIFDYMVEPTVQGDSLTYTVENYQNVIGKISVWSDSTPPKMGVLNTTLFLNSYDVVMNNPSFDINEYWPDVQYYRLNFYSFALVGDSITINGVTYPIGDGQTIEVAGKTYTLNNIFITTDTVDGVSHTFLTFADSRAKLDLGETTTSTVSFGGLWYFSSAFYEGYLDSGYEYDWNLDGGFSASNSQFMIIFIGLLVLGFVAGHVLIREQIGFLDYAIMIGSGVIGLIILGGFI